MFSKERKNLIKNLYCEKKAAISRLSEGPGSLVPTLIEPSGYSIRIRHRQNGHRIPDHGMWHKKHGYAGQRRNEKVMKAFFSGIIDSGIIDFICFVVGPFFTTYYLFDFSHGPAGPGPFYYYYRHNSQLGLALGVALICLGFLIRYLRKQTPSKSSQKLS